MFGAILPFLPAIGSAIGSIFGGGAKKAEDSRYQQAALQAQQDMARTSQYGIGQNAQMQQGQLDLDRKKFSEDARGGRARDATLAAILKDWKPTSVNMPGIRNAQISGGLQSLPQSAQAPLGELYKQALAAQLAGDTFQGGNILQAPGVQGIPKPSGLERAGGILGTIGSVIGALGSTGVFGGGQSQQPSITSQTVDQLKRLGVDPFGGSGGYGTGGY